MASLLSLEALVVQAVRAVPRWDSAAGPFPYLGDDRRPTGPRGQGTTRLAPVRYAGVAGSEELQRVASGIA